MMDLRLLRAQINAFYDWTSNPDQAVAITVDVDGEERIFAMAGWAHVQVSGKTYLCFLGGREVIDREPEEAAET